MSESGDLRDSVGTYVTIPRDLRDSNPRVATFMMLRRVAFCYSYLALPMRATGHHPEVKEADGTNGL